MSNTNLLMSFGRAIELAKTGISVSAAHWDLVDRLTGISAPMEVPTEQIWSPENRRMSTIMHGSDGFSTVTPYLTKFTRQGIVNYIPTTEDIYAQWMLSDVYPRLVSLKRDIEENDDVYLKFELISKDQHIDQNLPFADLYAKNMVGFGSRVFFIAANDETNRVNAVIYEHLAFNMNKRSSTTSYGGFTVDHAFFDNEEWIDYCGPDVIKYQFIEINKDKFDIDACAFDVTSPVNIFVDVDSLQPLDLVTGDTALDNVIHQCIQMEQKYPNINWIAVSVKDEMLKSKVNEGDLCAD